MPDGGTKKSKKGLLKITIFLDFYTNVKCDALMLLLFCYNARACRWLMILFMDQFRCRRCELFILDLRWIVVSEATIVDVERDGSNDSCRRFVTTF